MFATHTQKKSYNERCASELNDRSYDVANASYTVSTSRYKYITFVMYKMAAHLRVKQATCVAILLCFQVTFVFGLGRRDGDFVKDAGKFGNNDFDKVRDARDRGGRFDGVARERTGRDAAGPAIGADGRGPVAAAGNYRPNKFQQQQPLVQGQDRQMQVGLNQGLDNQQQMQMNDRLQRAGANMNAFQQPRVGAVAQAQPQQFDRFVPQQGQGQVQQLQGQAQQPLGQVQQPQAKKTIKSKAVPLKPVRIADHPACIADVQHICPRKGNNFAVLDCLQMVSTKIGFF